MNLPSWLTVVPVLVTRFFNELDRHRAEAKRIRREDRLNEIKEDPTASHADRFGPSAGRVSINPDDSNT
ncbi:conserved hypothetical protein [Vibrio crassostreae]|nr:conserved hypothetical protein [Vibrio crassostreae]CAK2101562.1 conserved hypothetical protein [Vibrio crassostreae]CAK2372951.1 conserved hypothetical protein [Vibrio crassostreae]CAK2913995.1 conserved hypothetical protein [Vibrio crassostreae]CAK2988490.1 conserved hypothetical protein [Vibrio crassostreae]